MPARSTAEMCTNTSLLPSSGWMKPKPLVPLNHLTVPVLIGISVYLQAIGSDERMRSTRSIPGVRYVGEMLSARPVQARRPDIWPKIDRCFVRHREDIYNSGSKNTKNRPNSAEFDCC